MSVSDGLKWTAAGCSRLKYLQANAAAYFALLGRKPRSVLIRPALLHLGAGILGAIAVIIVTMMTVDAPTVSVVQRLPFWLIAIFNRITDYGKSGWFLVPIGIMLTLIAALAVPALSAMSRRVLAAVAVRLGFLFAAIALPGLIFTILKRLIGRARPLVGGSADPFLYLPLGWNVEYASLPSGHAVNAFAAATAIGALWPKTRPLMWTYAMLIAVSRVVLTAHYPSDVLAGAIVGMTGAVLVRAWFASRRLAFLPGGDGRVRPMPGPSLARVKRVARQLIAP
jgi:membrane-associated phospholipid phosphatase